MIEPSDIETVAAWAKETGPGEDSLDALKAKLEAPLRFTFCSEDDISAAAKPVFEDEAFSLYLVGGGDDCNACVSLTIDFDVATGIVVAEVEPDD